MRNFRFASALVCSALLAACGNDDTGAGPARPGAGDTGRGSDTASDATDDVAAPDSADDTATPDSAVDAAPDTGGGGSCTPGTLSCVDLGIVGECSSDGSSVEQTPCPTDSYCLNNSGVCTPGICRPGTLRCGAGEADREMCFADAQSWVPSAPCPDDQYCDDGVCRALACLPRVMFAIDGSSSMTSQWPEVRASIAAVTSANPDVAFGLSMFPTGLGCSIGDGEGGLFSPGVNWPHVPISVEGSTAIDAWFAANDAAAGATPLISTINWFAGNAEAVWGPLLENAHLVVMTEGADTCRCEDDTACLVNQLSAATRALASTGVRVYVIGYRYGDAPEALNAIAENGGTSFTEFIYAGSEETLTTAFGEIVANAKLCEE